MADNSSSTSIVAIFAILLMVAIAGVLAWQAGVFGGRGDRQGIDINLKGD
jgi:hypothetical protein